MPVDTPLNLLFLCSRNRWRSPTAERIWRNHPFLSVRSAGTSRAARRRLSAADVTWADFLFVMEQKHKSRLLTDFGDLVQHKPVHVLDIPDDYQYMSPELVEMLTASVESILQNT